MPSSRASPRTPAAKTNATTGTTIVRPRLIVRWTAPSSESAAVIVASEMPTAHPTTTINAPSRPRAMSRPLVTIWRTNTRYVSAAVANDPTSRRSRRTGSVIVICPPPSI